MRKKALSEAKQRKNLVKLCKLASSEERLRQTKCEVVLVEAKSVKEALQSCTAITQPLCEVLLSEWRRMMQNTFESGAESSHLHNKYPLLCDQRRCIRKHKTVQLEIFTSCTTLALEQSVTRPSSCKRNSAASHRRILTPKTLAVRCP